MNRGRVSIQVLLYFFMLMFLMVTVACSSKDDDTPAPTTSTYTVIFDSQSATVAANPTSITVTSPATTVGTLPTEPTRSGYTFGGWYTSTSGGGTQFTASTTVAADITVYAKWTAISTTFSQDDLTGTWQMNLLKTGTGNKWQRFIVTVDSSGMSTGYSSCQNSTGSTSCPPSTVTLSIDSTGLVTISGNGDIANHMTMASNKNFMAGTSTTSDSTSYSLFIFQKVVPGTSYSNADV
jgi:uncharacterized repeat protein (TIGR02543 family)